jgi:hypothetical protein
MSTLDEITKEKQRIGEALARVEAQREKLTGQLSELGAAERVLARYSKGTPARKTAAAKTPTTATKAAAAPRPRRQRTFANRLANCGANRFQLFGKCICQPSGLSLREPDGGWHLGQVLDEIRSPANGFKVVNCRRSETVNSAGRRSPVNKC